MARYVYRLQVPHTGKKPLRIVLRFNVPSGIVESGVGRGVAARPQVEYREHIKSYEIDSSNKENLPRLRVVNRGTLSTEEYYNAESLLA